MFQENQNPRSPTSSQGERLSPDRQYIDRVISHLNRVRKQQKLGVRAVAARAGICGTVISRAERRRFIPDSKSFKAWAGALGLSWEQVWKHTFL
jgi:hypothetical protein